VREAGDARLFANWRRSPAEEGCVCAGLADGILRPGSSPTYIRGGWQTTPDCSVQFSRHLIRRLSSNWCCIPILSRRINTLAATGRRMQKEPARGNREFCGNWNYEWRVKVTSREIAICFKYMLCEGQSIELSSIRDY